jgi:hypothetical protein
MLVFLALAVLGFGLVSWLSGSDMILDQSVIDAATTAGAGDEALVASAEQVSAAGGAGTDDVIGSSLTVYKEEAAKGLVTWLGWVVATGFLLAVVWSLLALKRQASVYGPAGQSSARRHWLILLTVYVGALIAAYMIIIAPLELWDIMDDIYFYAIVVFMALLGLAGYWIATGLAASAVMRPSVPLALTL